MVIDSEESAMEYVRDWLRPGPGHRGGPSEANVRRFRRTAEEQRGIAASYGDRHPTARAGHLAAAEVLEREADLVALALENQGPPTTRWTTW